MNINILENEKAIGILKQRGPLPLTQLATEMSITKEGARFNLIKLAKEGFVTSSEIIVGRGRPKQIWSLTEAGHALFPDAHAEVAVKLIAKIKALFGDDGIKAVIESTSRDAQLRYKSVLDGLPDLETKVKVLAEIRNKEGYLARYEKIEEGYLLLEDHCPICAAAAACQNFCSSELQIFRDVLQAKVSRTEHLLDGGKRCVYRIV